MIRHNPLPTCSSFIEEPCNEIPFSRATGWCMNFQKSNVKYGKPKLGQYNMEISVILAGIAKVYKSCFLCASINLIALICFTFSFWTKTLIIQVWIEFLSKEGLNLNVNLCLTTKSLYLGYNGVMCQTLCILQHVLHYILITAPFLATFDITRH